MVPQHTGEINYNISTRPPPPPSPPPVLLGCCCSCCHCWCPMLLPAADAAVLICCVCSCFSKSKNWCCAQYVLRCVQQQSTAVKTNVAKHTWNIASKPFTEIGRPYTYTNTAKRCEAQHCRRTKQNQQHAADMVTLMDEYSRHPMIHSKPLPDNIKQKLASELSQVPGAFSLSLIHI